MRRLISVTLFAAMLSILSAIPVLAQQFPSKPVRMLIPWPAGGSTDVLGRALASELSTVWKQPVVVETKAGAAGAVGAQVVLEGHDRGDGPFTALAIGRNAQRVLHRGADLVGRDSDVQRQ